jgi:hypothetical protein
MTTRTIEELHTTQEEVVVQAPEIECWRNLSTSIGALLRAMEAYLIAGRKAEATSTAPGYQYWNYRMFSPIHHGNPPYRPSKIICRRSLHDVGRHLDQPNDFGSLRNHCARWTTIPSSLEGIDPTSAATGLI